MSSFFRIHFASLRKSSLSFIATSSNLLHSNSVCLDTYGMRCLWTILMPCPVDSCMFGSGSQEWCLCWPWRFGNYPGAVGSLGRVCVVCEPCEYVRNGVMIYSSIKTQLKNPYVTPTPCGKEISDYWNCEWALPPPPNHSLDDRYPMAYRLDFK